MLSLPIPDKRSPVRYRELSWRGQNVGELVERLTKGRQRAEFRAHLDPDLRRDALPRGTGWRPTLGQVGAAQAHLRNESVTVGDLFLFFGLFRPMDRDLRPAGPPIHVIWGWLQVGEILSIDDDIRRSPEKWRWLERHPHLAFGQDPRNTLYTAAPALRLGSEGGGGIPGSGVFDFFSTDRRLTAGDATRPSDWQLPRAFLPRGRRPLTFHGDPQRWTRGGDSVRLRAASRGQEFVLELDHYPDLLGWVSRLLGTV